ncbi:hypothetical protein PC114_g13848 [Phytophthora cactorum]|uniref:Uncharacterized protein n=2 Tax=Phytophthora cactorum TaxID=29920 RepID=A0A8T1E1F9_9STRA|nr:hypothetical protein PC114_g13848 [Phytophthora cactorum]KAG2947971.1 hypothetical protein PC117_g6384 [Phytophthora cactorum]KAG3159246.1 hypothetical protein C6341_g14136 [Phytophthora cactorum]
MRRGCKVSTASSSRAAATTTSRAATASRLNVSTSQDRGTRRGREQDVVALQPQRHIAVVGHAHAASDGKQQPLPVLTDAHRSVADTQSDTATTSSANALGLGAGAARGRSRGRGRVRGTGHSQGSTAVSVTASPSIRNQSEKSGVGPPRAGTTPIITRSPGPPQRTPPALLQDVYLDKLVAFPPEKELWMKSKHYRPVGTAFMVGRVCRRPLRGKFASLFEIRWLDSQFQLAVEHVSIGLVQCAVENYALLTRQKSNPDWQELVKKMLTIN